MYNTSEYYNEAFPAETLERLRRQREEWSRRDTAGRRFQVPRPGKDGVDTLLYEPAGRHETQALPVFFNMHGGAWVAGDAVLLDSFCTLMANEIPAFVVNVNYKKADAHPFPYPVEEIRDTVKYFAEHAGEYSIDPNRMAVGGHSAGAHLAAGAAIMLNEEGIRLACQMLVYPVTGIEQDSDKQSMLIRVFFPSGLEKGAHASPLYAPDEILRELCPAIFILCGKDGLRPYGIDYAKRLIDLAVPVKVKEYPEALHGFLEVNRPDYAPDDQRRSPEQEAYCRDAERYLIRELRACFGG